MANLEKSIEQLTEEFGLAGMMDIVYKKKAVPGSTMRAIRLSDGTYEILSVEGSIFSIDKTGKDAYLYRGLNEQCLKEFQELYQAETLVHNSVELAGKLYANAHTNGKSKTNVF